METYKQIVNIKNHTLNLLLPDRFKNGKVEVIVLPVDEQERTKKPCMAARLVIGGGRCWIRTSDPLLVRQVL